MRAANALIPLCLLLTTTPALAQFDIESQLPRQPRVMLGINLIVAEPQQEFADYIDTSVGGSVSLVWKPAARSPLAFRLEGGYIGYGHERKTLPFSPRVGDRIMVDLTTTNFIGFAHAGPQLMVPTGFLRPYIAPSIGFAYLGTVSTVKSENSSENLASDTNYDDMVLSYGATGGLYVPITTGKISLLLDLSARYQQTGTASYLIEGSITDNTDGTISFDPIRSSANMLSFQIGVSIGFASTR
jgi:hypothetical protein